MKKIMLSALLTVMFILMSGCSTIERLGDMVNGNPAFVNIAARQAVSRYIVAANTIEKEKQRANDVKRRVSKVLAYLDGSPTADVDSLMRVIRGSIAWDELVPPDRILVLDLVAYIEAEIRAHNSKKDALSEPATFAVKALLSTAISAAEIYLSR